MKIENALEKQISPRVVIDGTEALLERVMRVPHLEKGERDYISSILKWSIKLAETMVKDQNEIDRQEVDKVFQEYISKLQELKKNEVFWKKVGDSVPATDLNREKAEEFLADPYSYLGRNMSEDEKSFHIEKVRDVVRGTPTSKIKTELDVFVSQLENLFLMQVEKKYY